MFHPLGRDWRGFVCAAVLLAGGGAWAAEDFKTQEYWNSTGLDIINAATAYELGYTGKGVTLGILDDGVRLSHREFAGKDAFQVFIESYVEDWAENEHGSHVAGIMAANRDGSDADGNMQGVAFDAGLASAARTFGYLNDDVTRQIIAALTEAFSGKDDIKVINNSWGNYSVGYYFWLDEKSLDFIRSEIVSEIGAALLDLSVREGKLIVFAASNSGNLGPISPASYPTFYPEATAWLSVMALDPSKVTIDSQGKKTLGDEAIANFSNLAFGAEEYSLLAPGVDINSINSANLDGYTLMSGTSMAAPYVTGAAGLVQQAYPWMSGKQLADTLLSTADRDFNYPDFYVDMDETSNIEIIDESTYTEKISLQVRLLFIDEKKSSYTDEDVQARLKEFYDSNSRMLENYYGIDSLDKFLRVYEGTAAPKELLVYSDGTPYYEAVLSGDAQAASFDQVYGQGILDAGKAVRGPSQLNMNRLSTADAEEKYGLLYKVDFDDSYGPSVFANDIEQKEWIASHHLVNKEGVVGEVSEEVSKILEEYKAMEKYDKVGFLKDGTGTLFMTGTNTYEGPTVVRGGTLSISKREDGTGGELVSSSVYVETAGRLQGNGVIQNAVTNDGAVAPGNSIGTLTVESYSGGGTLELEGNASGGDLLIVKGSAVVKKVNFVPLGYFADGTTALKLADFLQAGSPDTAGVVITGTTRETATVTITTDKQSSESFSFITTRAANAYSSLGNSAGGTAAGRALDQAAGKATGDGAVLVGTIDFLSAQGVAAALDQLHPEAYDSLLYSAMDNSHRLSGMIADRMTSRNVPTGYKMNWYFQPFGTISRQNDWGGYGGFKSQSSGVLIGGEKRRGDWTLGVHGGFIHDGTSVWAASPLSSTSDGGFIGLQAKRAADPEKGLFLYGLARVGWDRYETTRSVALSDSCRENGAKWTGFSGAVEIGAGWNHKSGKTMLTPVAALNYAMVTRPGFSEIGSGSALNLDSADYQSLRSSLGVKVSFAEGRMDKGVKYALDASALWHHEFLDRGPRYDWTLLGGPSVTRWREGAGRDSVGLNLGAEFSDSDRFSVRAAAGTELFRPGASSFTGSLRVEWKF